MNQGNPIWECVDLPCLDSDAALPGLTVAGPGNVPCQPCPVSVVDMILLEGFHLVGYFVDIPPETSQMQNRIAFMYQG